MTWYGQSLVSRQSGSAAYGSFDIPGRIDMTMADPPDLRFLWSILVYAYTAFRPLLTEDLVSKLSRCRDALRIFLVKRVHNRVRDGESFILKGRVAGECVDELAEGGKVPKKAPSFHIGHDQIGRSQLEVLVGLQIGELR